MVNNKKALADAATSSESEAQTHQQYTTTADSTQGVAQRHAKLIRMYSRAVAARRRHREVDVSKYETEQERRRAAWMS